ncbi:MAG: hypothetical protein ABI134_20465, partial [Byssovorax sp.]
MASEPGAEPEPEVAPLSAGSREGELPSPPVALPPGRRFEVLATLAIVGAFLVAVAARPLLRRMAAHPSREQCGKMLDRYAEAEARAANPSREEKGGSLDSAPARTIAAATLDRCTHDLTEEEVACALRSNGADE